VKSDQAVG